MATMVMGLFDDRQEAIKAQSALQGLGIPMNQMYLVDQPSTATETTPQESWWDRIKSMFDFDIHDEDRPYYNEGLRRGGTLLSVRADESRADAIAGIFADHNAVDIDTRGNQWKEAGWTPEDRIAIPVVQEEVHIGKRQIRRGGVRVYTSITETPIEESVTLREEHAEVTRRPADRGATASDMAASEPPIEITETAEEPVVSKQAKVVEEVVVKKAATERTETVKDTVRRKDVDVKKAS